MVALKRLLYVKVRESQDGDPFVHFPLAFVRGKLQLRSASGEISGAAEVQGASIIVCASPDAPVRTSILPAPRPGSLARAQPNYRFARLAVQTNPPLLDRKRTFGGQGAQTPPGLTQSGLLFRGAGRPLCRASAPRDHRARRSLQPTVPRASLG
jgi:hypothetical protein